MKTAIIALVACTMLSQTGSSAKEPVSTVIQPMHIGELGVPSVLRNVAERARIQIGLETDVQYGQERRESLDFSGGTITQLAEKCAALLPGASWRVIDGNKILISRPSKAATLAQIKMDYKGARNATRKEVWLSLSHQEDLNQAISSKGCRRLDLFFGHSWDGDQPTINIKPGHTSLQQLLQTAIGQSDRHYWNILDNRRSGQCEVIIQVW